ncbi:carboxylate--amine ligase [bacterium]|nr:carboxylate--amine ligase [bacterium]
MAKIVVTGAGSAQSNGVINCLLMDKEEKNVVIGLGSDRYDLMLCKAHKKYLIPHSTSAEYEDALLKVLKMEKPDMIHFQHDKELSIALMFREKIEDLGIKMLVPDYQTIDTCVYKYKSWEKFKAAGIKVPENIIINTQKDLKRAFDELGGSKHSIWLRSMDIGGGGKGALPTNNYEEAYEWISKEDGWGKFVAAELLDKKTVTWLSIWYKGELICAQGRKRCGWAHSALSPSGVTGVTRVGETYSSVVVDEIGMKACKAVSSVPHGIYGVDMTYDFSGIPNPTEINISRFFTTVQFFAEAGLNMPVILKNLCLYDKKPHLQRTCNPLPDGLLWLRGMDCEPRLVTEELIKQELL